MKINTDRDIGMYCVKYLLCLVNAVFVITGMMIMSIGTTLHSTYYAFSHFLDSSYISTAKLLILIGGLIFIIAFFGCYGALKESTAIVLTFAVCLFMILFLELSVATATYAYHDEILAALGSKINVTMHQYETNIESRDAIDFLQSNMYCCGYDEPSDWSNILKNTTENKFLVPESCCYGRGPIDHCPAIFPSGCFNDLVYLVDRSALYVLSGAVVVMLLQSGGVVFACLLGKSIRYHKTMREVRRWQNSQPSPNQPDEPLKKNPTSNLQEFI